MKFFPADLLRFLVISYKKVTTPLRHCDKGLLDGKQLKERSNLIRVTGKIASVGAFSHLRRLTSRKDAREFAMTLISSC